ncbi:MAG: hypothetical protein ACK5BA_01530, partial [Gemmatimonas sp.]
MMRKLLLCPTLGTTLLPAAVAALSLSGCAGSRPTGAGPSVGGAPTTQAGAAVVPGAPAEMQRLYRAMGLVAGAGTIPVAASGSCLRAPSPDRTLTLGGRAIP